MSTSKSSGSPDCCDFYFVILKLLNTVFNKFYFQVNGLSNKFWGWGREDDELYLRMKEAKMSVSDLHFLNLPFSRLGVLKVQNSKSVL